MGRELEGVGVPPSLLDDLVVLIEVEPGPSFTIASVGGLPVSRGDVSPAATTGLRLEARPEVTPDTLAAVETAWASHRPQRCTITRAEGRYELQVTPIVERDGSCSHLVMHVVGSHSHAARRRDMVNAAIVDAIPGSVALLDAEGVIRAVNAGWIRFGLERSHDGVLADAGTSYLDVAADADPSVPGAREAVDAIRAVLAGDLAVATTTYEANSDLDRAWFTMRVAPVEVDEERWAVVIHEDISELQAARERTRRAETQLGVHRELLELVAAGTPLRDVALAVAANIGRLIDGASGGVALRDDKLVTAPDLPDDWLPFTSAPPPRVHPHRAAWGAPARLADGSVGAAVLVTSRSAPTADDEATSRLLASVLRLALQRDEMVTTTRARLLLADDVAVSGSARALGAGISAEEITRALRDGEIGVHYQPIVDLRTGRTTGLEALVRWQCPDRGAVPPPALVHAAERHGLMGLVGDHVLRTACDDLARWHAEGRTDLRMAVNLSVTQLADDRLLRVVRDSLERTRIDPAALVVEITESVVVDDVEQVASALASLRDLGVRVAIDDFGTGYSSLLYLKRFPADVLKVDRAFVEGLGVHEGDTAIVDAVVGLAHQLGLEVVAEGVETDVQLQELRRRRCDHAQGYLLQRPVPADEIDRFLGTGSVDLGPEPAALVSADQPAVDQLLAVVGHELSTPLTAIGGHLLRTLVGDIPLSHGPVDLAALVTQIVADLSALTAQHDVRVQVPIGPVRVRAESVGVRHILTNLLANAVKATSRGSRIDVVVRETGELAVIDHGEGVPAALESDLFDRSRTAGLGLSRALARRQGGDLVYERTPDGGATFVLHLP